VLNVLYACAIFLGAFLLFQVEPIIGKMLLPWFGGSAGVWTTCLLFFQSLLLLGYLYAHWITRYLKLRAQGIVHLMLLCLSLATLPLALRADWKPAGAEEPVLLIFGLLALTIGLPFFVLSTTGPLLQAWIARRQAGAAPYRLFALSNFASLLALVGYPVLAEPWLTVHAQTVTWSIAYLAFVLACGALAWHGLGAGRAAPWSAPVSPPLAPDAPSRALWVALAACPAILLMAVTSYLTQDIVPVPLLWVLPLGLYLLSFILCFEGKAWYRRAWYVPIVFALLAAMSYRLAKGDANIGALVWIAVYVCGLFAACMACHGELAKLKPHPLHLTTYYLMIAAGGALGGGVVAVAAPYLFNSNYELPVGIVATAALLATTLFRDRACRLHRVRAKLAWLALAGAIAALAGTLAYGEYRTNGESRLMRRNFYGTLRVVDEGSGHSRQRTLYHGTIIHGTQYRALERRGWPTTYYGETTGVGLAIVASRTDAPQRVGVIGLGVGTVAAYGRRGDYYRFYEINPLVIPLARSQFTFLADTAATVEVAVGDARLSLEKESSQHFDVLVVDAFSGDSVPAHLLTREAFDVYLRHLKPDGILAVHVSNKYLNLAPIVKLNADAHAKTARLVDTDEDDDKGVMSAVWVLVGGRPGFYKAEQVAAATADIEPAARARLWTDDYSSIYAILKPGLL